jgi:hypothetical protein
MYIVYSGVFSCLSTGCVGRGATALHFPGAYNVNIALVITTIKQRLAYIDITMKLF